MTNQPLLSTLNLNLIPSSQVISGEMEFALAQFPEGRKLVVAANPGKITDFDGHSSDLENRTLFVGPLSHQNANLVRSHLQWTNPSLHGLKTSAGMGDRIGLATPGHIRAIRATGSSICPNLAQQSMREMSRIGRTAANVMDDALWGVLAEGWKTGFGADADHLKTTDDIDLCLAAGFTFFTIDPGLYVNNQAETASFSELQEFASQLPAEIQPNVSGLAGKLFDLEGTKIEFTDYVLLKAAVKYGKAVAHLAALYDHLAAAAGKKPFEFEVSVDETELPTSPAEHIYVSSELKRLGVNWVSLAPRFIGRFEKGVDYIGDLNVFEKDFAAHAAIARMMGPYKISLHSGSDKFSIYPITMKHTQGLVHLKTAGTSYLEALRTIAVIDPVFFKELYQFAREHYETDKASYHVSADLKRAPLAVEVNDWPALIDQFDAREILHVTFGSVLSDRTEFSGKGFYPRFMELIQQNQDTYSDLLVKHFTRHLSPFSKRNNYNHANN
jgi:hypothetical protein